jgi:ribosomal-protein-alanine N-acetyltransferase
VLRLPAERDVPELIRYYSDNLEHLGPWSPEWPPDHLTESFWRDQVASYRMEANADRSLRLYLFPKDRPRRVIGNASLTGIVRGPLQACYLGYGLDAAEQGKGYMVEAVKAAVSHAFRELGLHRVMANYMPHNRRSGAVLRRAGFTVDGYARDYLLINGRWEDHVLTSATPETWPWP